MKTEQKNVVWNAIGSTTNAFISLVFAIISTRINGIEDAGIFSFGFATACILFVLGGYIVRVFQVTDRSGGFTDTDYLHNRIITCLFMMLAAIGFVIVRGYSIYKTGIILLLCFYKCTEAFSEVLYGFLQKNNKLYIVGISLFLKAVCSMICFLIVDLITRNLLYSCTALVLSYLIFIAVLDFPAVSKLKLDKSPFCIKRNLTLLKVGFYTFLTTILGIYLINVSRYIIDAIYDDSIQTVYGILIMPATFMGLLGQYIIQPCLVKISELIKINDYFMLKKFVVKIILTMAGLGVAVLAVAFVLEEPVLSLVYGIDLSEYKVQMMIIMAGAIFYGLQTILSYVLIAFRKTGIQAILFSVISAVSTAIAIWLVVKYETFGAAFTYFTAMLMMVVSLVICTFKALSEIKKKNKI